MMLRTGNKKGFTLIEVMITTAVLALGTVLISEAFFISLDSFNYCSHYLNVAPFANEKIWQVQNSLSRLGPLAQIETAGIFTDRNKNFTWSLTQGLIDETEGLYRIDLALSWQEGQRRPKLLRTAYARYEEKE